MDFYSRGKDCGHFSISSSTPPLLPTTTRLQICRRITSVPDPRTPVSAGAPPLSRPPSGPIARAGKIPSSSPSCEPAKHLAFDSTVDSISHGVCPPYNLAQRDSPNRPISTWTMSDSPESDVPNPVHARPAMAFPSCKSECIAEGLAAVHDDGEMQYDASGNWNDGAQTAAIEHLVTLKQGLRTSDTELFWKRLMEDITSISKAQYGFVARRVHGGEPMPELGGRRPSLFGAVFYYNDGYQNVGLQRDRYFAGGNPLLHMDHERPCLIPENLKSLASFGDDQLPFGAEAYLAIPLFSAGKCLAHLGLMWSKDGLRNRNLSWSFLEMVLHSLEDLIVQRLSLEEMTLDHEKSEFPEIHPATVQDPQTGNLHESADFNSQPLKPYARSLSHELRTPMQGVVGMLDVMHATVREAMESKTPVKSGGIFQALKEGIEMVQDSARRAVEAADNVVHAYDLNMQVPKTPQREESEVHMDPIPPIDLAENRPSLFIEGNNIAVNPPETENTSSFIPARALPRSEEVKNAVHESDQIVHATPARQIEAVMANMVDPRPSLAVRRSAPHLLLEGINMNLRGSALRFTKLRDLLRLVINESLHVGGRPDSAVSHSTEFGEKIEIRSRSSNGEIYTKTVDWSVDPALPDTLLADDRDLAKLISCVFLNAIKFTNNGTITVCATIDHKTNDVLIRVGDTGPGIPAAFLPNLFKPFAREDASTTRSKDGLGLGLLVAKGLSRKMGGDLICVRSSTTGPNHGSEFQIRIPVNQHEACNRPGTPNERMMTPPVINDHSRHGSASSFIWEVPSTSSMSPSVVSNQHLQQPTPSTGDDNSSQSPTPPRPSNEIRPTRGPMSGDAYDKNLGEKYPLRFLVAEDNRINRRVLVNMLRKLGYRDVLEAADGREAVQIVQDILSTSKAAKNSTESNTVDGQTDLSMGRTAPEIKPIDVVLMDLWMPEMDGYEATSRILKMVDEHNSQTSVSVDGSRLMSTVENPDTMEMDPPVGPLRPPRPPTVLAVSADVTDEALNRASKVGIKGYMTKPYKLSDLERLIIGFCGSPGDPAAAARNPF
ncbi:CheY-like superfamily [Penicillium argentinense]|uniref:histidine kinase n=1 Tax=Penicillium argentinense TaxID=1131581 RepID=A0A9W9KMJ2_9EURO|nr:CheY-like superfamily [Penicillium argentinense]KAJ5112304.1 CheY-like superfamily [Penicillium argentinense]